MIKGSLRMQRVLGRASEGAVKAGARRVLVDAMGDLALAGGPLHGRFIAHRTGHDLNNRLLRALFADSAAWRAVGMDPLVAAA